MKNYMVDVLIFALLWVGFALLLGRIRWLQLAQQLMRRTMEEMETSARKRLLSKRRNLLALQRENSLWYRLEQSLNYCGLRRRFPFLTAELWVVGNLIFLAGVFLAVLLLVQSLFKALLAVLLLWCAEILFLRILRAGESRSVSNNLLEFLNFLGNYSITAGELTGVFDQISRYVEEPMKSALEECCYEAQVTGDTGLALLSMAEKIEHPKFRELVHNMEVSTRYCADFRILVDTSRRSVREYLRMSEDRKSMLGEALINMLLLLLMSTAALITVDELIGGTIWETVFYSVPGWIALGIVAVIFLLFTRRLLGLHQ